MRADLGLGRGKIAAQAAHAVAAAQANLGTPDLRAWLPTARRHPGRDRTVYPNSQLGRGYRTQAANSIHYSAAA